MKKLLLSCLMLLTMVGSLQAKTENVNLTFECGEWCAASWDGTSRIFSWGSGGWNPAFTFTTVSNLSGDVSDVNKLVFKFEDWTNTVDNKLTIYFKENKGNTQSMDYVAKAELVPDANGDFELDMTTFEWVNAGENPDNAGQPIDKTNIVDVTIYGGARTDDTQNGSVKISTAYMEKEVADVEEPFEDPALPEGGVVIKEMDYTTQTKYPYYWMGDRDAENKELQPYFANGTATVQIVNHALEITNTSVEGDPWAIQPFIIDQFKIKKNYDYIIRVIYKSTAGGNIRFDTGKWGTSVPIENIPVEETTDYKVLDVKYEKISIETNENEAHVLWQSRKLLGTTRIYKVQVIEIAPDDPLLTFKEDLQAAIVIGNTQNSFAKTTESFATLTDAITAAETALTDEGATEESLTAAKKAITDAIAGFELQDRYTNLTKDMFRQWNDNNTPTTSTAVNGAYVLNESTGQVFGEGNVYYKNFADISDFNKLYVLISAGEARVQMNRETDGGTTHIAYRSAAVSEVDFATATELSGFDFVHLNAIKDNWAGVTVSGMYLYRTLTVSDAGMASFGTLYKTANLSSADAVYGAKFEGDGVKLIPVDSKNVPAGVGVLVEGSDEIVPKFDVEAAEIDGNELKVSNGTVSGEGIYVLANKDKGLGFYKLAPDAKVPAGKAYLQVANGSREYIAIDGGATAIKNVEAENANGAIYNLAGQQVKNAQKGIFILNGKKVIK